MEVFNHFIITRFNLKQAIWEVDKNGFEVNDDYWLKERYSLFERFCFPSMELQSLQNFKWLVYFDNDTPEIYKHRNEKLRERYSNFIPVYVSNFKAFEQGLSDDIMSLINGDLQYIITTRLDNDDCFHNDAIKTIQKHFVKENMVIVDFQNGLTLEVHNGYKLALRKNVISGPFISLIELVNSNEKLVTVYNREHTHWGKTVKTIAVKEGFFWLQTIHDKNISNSLGKDLTFDKSILKGYEFIEGVSFNMKYYVFVVLKEMGFFRMLNRIGIK